MPLYYRGLHICFATLLLAANQPGAAQSVPDAGRLLEQIRPALSLPRFDAPKIQIEERVGNDSSDGVRIRLSRLRISGATRFDQAELQSLVTDAEGQDLSLGELQQLAARLTGHYRSRGFFLARAYLPAQEINNGEVEIAILEGRLGQIDINNSAGVIGAALAPLTQLLRGDLAHDATLERNLLLLSDVPGVEVQSTLKPGLTLGASDLLVDVTDGRAITGSLDLNSFGDRFSGQYRLGGVIDLNNPWHLGDQMSLRIMTSDEQMSYLRAAYQLPINALGTRIGVAGSEMHYRLGGTVASLNAHGEARTGSVYLLHPFVRSRRANLRGELQYDRKSLGDRIAATSTVVEKTLDNWTVGISGDFLDEWGGGGANSFSLSHTAGELALDSETAALDSATARSADRFGKFSLSWLRQQRVTDAASLYFSATGQFASKNLDSSEKISLGGANGVRAYPQGEAAGDEGYLLTLETRYQLPLDLPGQWQLTAFVDHGQVSINKNTWAASSNTRRLRGVGVGLNVMQLDGWRIKASLAWTGGTEMPPSDEGRSSRGWIQVIKSI